MDSNEKALRGLYAAFFVAVYGAAEVFCFFTWGDANCLLAAAMLPGVAGIILIVRGVVELRKRFEVLEKPCP